VSGASEAALLEALDDAITARILVGSPEHVGRYRFAHSLVRETVYDELSSPRRVRLHAMAGEVLQRLHDDTDGARLADIAHHFSRSVEAGDPERAIAACVRASQWASSRQAWEDAALHLERAIEILETVDDPDPFRRCDLVVTLAETEALGTDAARTQRTALRGFELAKEAGLARHLARAALAYGAHFLDIESGRVDATMTTLLEEALAALGTGDPALRASLLLRLAQELTFSSEVERIGTLLDEATRLAEAIGDPALQAAVALGAQFGFRFGHEDEALAEGHRLVALAREAGDAAIEQRAWSQVVWGGLWLGRIEEARQAIEEERRLGEELRTPFARYLPIRHDSMMAVLEGRFGDARAINRRAEEIAGSAVGTTNLAQWTGAQRVVAGRLRGTTMRPNRSRSYADRTGHPLLRAFLMAIFASAGERNDARRELGILAADDFGGIARDESWLVTLMLAADVTYELEEARYAAPLYDLLLPWKGRFPCVGPIVACLGPVDLRLGQLALLLGRKAAGEEHFRDAIGLSAATGARPYLAEARAALGAVLLARGGPEARDAATDELRLAWQLASELGMQRVAAAVRASGLVSEAGA
jgi:hypothetical protein